MSDVADIPAGATASFGPASNRYFVCLRGDPSPIPWDIRDESDLVRTDCRYFGRVLREVEAQARSRCLTVYLTWDVERLPSYGPDVVAVVVGDEDCRRPAYTGRVRVVFKSYGARPRSSRWRPRRRGLWLSILLLGQDLLLHARHVGDDVRDLRDRLARRPRGRIVDIPPGYFNQLDVPFRPFDERPVDVFFSGSLGRDRPRWSPRHYLRRPRQFARANLLSILRHMEAVGTQLTLDVGLTATFSATTVQDYSEQLMAAKVALVPRGNLPETCRLFEAARAGCVVITEELPSRWFYQGSPFVQIDRWRDLPQVLDRLLAEPRLLAERHAQTLRWWHQTCSEAALGAEMARIIDASAPDEGHRY